MRLLISACLLGCRCRYDGASKTHPLAEALARRYRLGGEIGFIPGMGVPYGRLDAVSETDGRTYRRELGIPDTAFLMVYAAEFSRRKHQAFLIQALRGLPERAMLLLPGEGAERGACQALAEELGLSPVDTVMHVLSACEGSVACIYFCINEDDMLNIMRDMRIALGSDGYGFSYDRSITRTNPHPRSFGTFPRFLELARDHRLMPLEDAVYKITGLPADILGLKDRGTLEEGRIADITVFDPEQVRDLSEYTDSVKKPAGIRHVLVGGTFALKDGAATGSRTGTVLKKG